MEKKDEQFCDNSEELREIDAINQALNNLRVINSTGEENSLENLLIIPELNGLDGPNEETITFIEELLNNAAEQKIINEDDDLLSVIQEDDFLEYSEENDLERDDAISFETKANENTETEDEEPTLTSDSSPTSSSLQSAFSLVSNFLSSSKKGTSSSQSSSSSSRTSYFSRFLRKTQQAVQSSVFSIPSVNSQTNGPDVDPQDLAIAERIIEDTEAQGPTGTPHLSSVAAVLQRPILAFSSSMQLRHRAGRNFLGEPILLQFHSPKSGMSHGHWTHLGNATAPEEGSMDLNNCLFNAICAQTGQKPSELRREMIREMKKKIRSLARRIRATIDREECDGIVISWMGGASYSGSSPNDCKKVIDNSQQGRCHPGHQQGHPRGHASCPEATGQTESAENYSRNGWKTGFLSREDQDAVGHAALITPQAQQAMSTLNSGSVSRSVHLLPSQVQGTLPNCAEFRDGVMNNPVPIRSLVLVLRHHAGHANEPDYPVFVHTFYPKVN